MRLYPIHGFKHIQIILFGLFCTLSYPSLAQQSVARQWNDVLLASIKNDQARPTVNARYLFHLSAAMYDAWAIFEEDAEPYLIGTELNGETFELLDFELPTDSIARVNAQERAISYASYRLMLQKFRHSPGTNLTNTISLALMLDLGLDPTFISTDYADGNPAALGNYIAESYIRYGLVDQALEESRYQQDFLDFGEATIDPNVSGNELLDDINNWQPLAPDGGEARGFLTPHWSLVFPFALTLADLSILERDNLPFWVYHDPGAPDYMSPESAPGLADDFRWGFALCAIWSSHLDPANERRIDISPASQGNVPPLSGETDDLRAYYNFFDGGAYTPGHSLNPITNTPYDSQFVKMGDYGRVVAEYWADGPDSETPPGHWFELLKYVSDNPIFEKRYKGVGPIISDLEWDIKSYFLMGAAMHDAAISAWSVKAYYNYVRPLSAIRSMAIYGQSSDSLLPNYDIQGLPLINGYIELVNEGDPLVGENQEHLHKIKMLAWKGPDYIGDQLTEHAGVDWILAENWWPYQEPSFITPDFAGYVSGHSTFSCAAAEILTMLTGDPFWPGGMGEFFIPKDEFLRFENGPSEDVTLQWATYRDASQESSLSRMWGGIHPPVDDVRGRLIGEKVALATFELADEYFGTENVVTNVSTNALEINALHISPNPTVASLDIQVSFAKDMDIHVDLISTNGIIVDAIFKGALHAGEQHIRYERKASIPSGNYFIRMTDKRSGASTAQQLVLL